MPARTRQAESTRPQPRALTGSRGTPYDAADPVAAEMADWFPWLGSPDLEINVWRDRIVARIRDLVRNDGWASGAVTRILDSCIGGDLRLIPRPDHRYLKRQWSAAFDGSWAEDFSQAVQELWRSYAYDPNRWCDGARRGTVSQLFRLAFRHKLVDGEALAVLLWRQEGFGPGQAQYRTALQLIDPDRLSNPTLMFDTRQMRDGVEIDQLGAPVAYHIRRAHQGDWFNAPQSWIWDRIERETPFGRPHVLHDYDPDRTGQHRATGIFTPVLSRMKMLARYDQVEMQAAVVNATLAAFIESPYDPADVQDALQGYEAREMGGSYQPDASLRAYQNDRIGFHEDRRLKLAGARISALYPGEKLSTVASTHPGGNFEAFENAMLRNISSGIGATAEEVSNDWAKMNYSSARAALMQSWKTYGRRRSDFAAGFCSPFYAAWLEEAFDRDQLPLPAGAPDFIDARAAYSACRWMGPGRGWIDPIKEAQAATLRMDSGITSLIEECADQGLDVEDVLDSRAALIKGFERRGLPLPGWAVEPGQVAERKPKPQ